jgi:long-chain fatty acid transport protein
MKRTRLLGAWLGCLCSLWAGAVWADGVSRDGVGAISVGRGGTNVAHFDNGVILLDNPAALVNIPTRGLFEFGFDGLIVDLHYNDPENDAQNKRNPVGLPTLSYIHTSEDGQWAYGLGLFAPAGFSAQWDLNNPLLGRQHYKSFGALTKFLPGVAYRVNDRLSVGGTFGVAVSHAEIEGPYFVQSPPLRGAPTILDLQATGAAPTWSVGLQYQLSDRTTLGLAYIDETRFRMDGNARVNILGVTPAPLTSSFDAEVDLVWPRYVAGGISHFFGDCNRHRVSAEVVWFDWSHAFDRIDLQLSDSSNPVIPALLGPTVRESFPLNWDDSVSVRLGYEFFFTNCDVVRLGYIYHPNPIPNETLTPYIPAILEHAVSVGYGRQGERWGFNVAYQYSFGPEENVGRSALAGGDFDNSRFESEAHWLTLSFTLRY